MSGLEELDWSTVRLRVIGKMSSFGNHSGQNEIVDKIGRMIYPILEDADTRISSLEADRENLWKMLDNISTFGDMYKPLIDGYFKAVNKECEKRSAIISSPPLSAIGLYKR